MKKMILLLPFLLAVTFLTCKKEPEPIIPFFPPASLTLDQRLIGGRWYQIKFYNDISHYYYYLEPEISEGYYKFTEDNTLVFSDETKYKTMLGMYGEEYANSLSGKEVYSKNGVVYWKHSLHKVMSYSFHTSKPDPNNTFYQYGGLGWRINEVVDNGDYITYRLYKDDGEYYDTDSFWFFLVRFKDDGTPYHL